MTSTRYVLTPDPGTILDDYIQAAIAAVTAISGRPLDSLDAIPERLRYLFREEVVFQYGTGGSGPTSPGAGGCAKVVIGPIKDLKVSLTGDAVKADEIGYLADIMKLQGGTGGKSAPACPICSLPMIDTDGGCVRHDPEEIAAWVKPAAAADDEATVNAIEKGMRSYTGTMRGHAIGALEVIRRGEVPGLPSPHEFAKVKAEIERLKADISAQSNLANAAGKVIDELKSEIDELRNFCDKGVASNDRLLQVVDQRDALNNEVERLRAEIVTLRASSGEF